MIFSEQWLREWVSPDFSTQELMDQLTMAGLEVDGSEPVAREFSDIVVARIESIEKHPDADKLNVCTVNDGAESYQVVCGAPNARAGLVAPLAKVGAAITIPEESKPFKIKPAKLRGVESNGMLCSAEELGLEESSDGLLELFEDAKLGMSIREHLSLDDTAIELDLTPNRGDCLGMIGLAREVGVFSKNDVSYPSDSVVEEKIEEVFPISITAVNECPRYLGRLVRNINLNASSPFWLKEKLRRSGLRSIDPVVDVTNFVLLELGQPMHAFDFQKLEGRIDVRLATQDEELTLLDGKEVKMTSDTLVITDEAGPVAMAGIMGGLRTSVSSTTKDVFLECAFFSQLAVAGKARSYGMHTDASHRYERGVDYELQHRAMARATELLLSIAGGEAGPVVEALGELPNAVEVTLNYGSVNRILGITIEREEIKDILQRLGFELLQDSDESLKVKVPSFRFDVSIEADLIEELARIYGYNNLPKTPGLSKQELKSTTEASVSVSSIRQLLVSLGYQEAITYSFVDPSLAATVLGDTVELIRLQNPISEEMSVMRPSLLPGLIGALKYNQNRQQERARLFESGLVFQKEGGETRQIAKIAGLIWGSRIPQNWNSTADTADFFDLKGDVEQLLALSGDSSEVEFKAAEHPSFHGGQCAELEHRTEGKIGYIGAIHPSIGRELGLVGRVYAFELLLEKIQLRKIPKSLAPSKFPEVNRDLAIVLDEEIASAQILANIREQAGEFLVDLRIFDVYQGDAVAQGKKSVALGLTWQHPSRNLTDDEINAIISNTVNALQEQFNANLRN